MKLVADIGGTHARFALLDASGAPTQIQNLKTADFQNLTDAMKTYLGEGKRAVAWRAGELSAVVSIAAPLSNDRVKMTNAAWDFSIQKTQSNVGLKSLRLVNDFEALALAVPTLQADELAAVGHDLPLDTRLTKAILGPGTGLGMAGVMPVTTNGKTTWYAMPCEGGHASVAATNEREALLLQSAWKFAYETSGASHSKTHESVPAHCCWESLLSGTGLPLLHRAVCLTDGFDYEVRTAEQIGFGALKEKSPPCVATLATFCELLGSAAGDLALMMGARGGVYIKGGVLDRMLEMDLNFFKHSKFRERFEAKGAYAGYLQAIPTWFIKTPQLALRGCATLL